MANFSKPTNMMSMVFAFFALLQFTAALGHGHAHAHRSADQILEDQVAEVQSELFKRQNGGIGPRISISGVCSTGVQWWGDCNQNGRQSYPRLEIRQLRQNSDQWNLYLIGMERFMSKGHEDRLSYYQIAGIHGRPYTTWNGFPTPLVNQAGFCPHSSTLFGTWHRPYLAIFEQAWYLAVTEVINDFPENQRQRWRNAAATLRMPYWDWAQELNNEPMVPTLIRDQQVSVEKPQGRVTIDNPLYSFRFGDRLDDEMGGGPWNSWPRTLRRPVGNPTRSNNNEMNGMFENLRVSLRDRVFALFASKQSWGLASTEAIGVRTDLGDDSFESVHDVIHFYSGGESEGHMYYLDYSAFDPLFWLHHTNVDRLLAMYQYVVPDTYVANGNINNNMAQWNRGEAKNGNSPLKPFTKSTWGDYFTSNDVRETRTLGYHYPETSDRSYSQVVQAVSRMYGAGVRSISKRDSPVDPKNGQYQGREMKEGDYHHVLTVTAEKYAMTGSYVVHCFIGNDGNTTSNSTAPYPISNSTTPYPVNVTSSAAAYAPSSTPSSYAVPINGTREAEEDYDPKKDITNSPDFCGSYGILGMQMQGNHTSDPIMTRGSLPLTTCLQGKEYYGKLKSLKPEDVEPYLAKNLYYKVFGPNGEVDPSSVKNLHISVACTKVVPAKDGGLPDLSSPYKELPKATDKLPAGKPFVYQPTPLDIPLPPGSGSYEEGNDNGGGKWPSGPDGKPVIPGTGIFPYPTLPWQESGYCAKQQTIKYVYPDGKEAYSW